MDEDDIDRLIGAEANALWEKLRVFAPKTRLFVLAEIANRVTRKLRSRESTQYSIEWPQDEPPTDPAIPNIDRDKTRAIKTSDLEILKKKSEKS